MPVSLARVVARADRWLSAHPPLADYPGALNGLQLENNGRVTRLAAAVDAHADTIHRALEMRADLLIVHHGIGWSPLCPISGARYRWLRAALAGNLAIYSSHLPLDSHPTLGNNALLARKLGLRRPRSFFEAKGVLIGRLGEWTGSRKQMSERLNAVLGAPPVLLPGGPERIRRVAVVTGGAGNELARAAEAGADTFITGEGHHWTYGAALELGLNVFYGGHYRTEVFGVQALTARLARAFRLPWAFIDCPTGL